VQIKNRQQFLGIIAIVAVGLLAGDKWLRAPLYNAWQSRRAEIGDLRKRVAEGKNWLGRESSLRARWQNMRTNTFPNNASVAERQVLNAFDRWCRDSGITRESFTPQWKHDADNYMTLECHVDASGKISAVTRFLYEIEKDPMAFRLENVEISSRDAEGQMLAIGLQISALVLSPQEKQK